MKVVGGCDPGSSGTVWFIKPDKQICPIIRFSGFNSYLLTKRKWCKVADLLNVYARAYDIHHLLLEHVHDLPGDRGDILAEFMQNTGRIKMLLELCNIDYSLIQPVQWQLKAGVGGDSHKKPGMTDAQIRAARKAKHLKQARRILEVNNIKTTEPLNQETADGFILAVLAYNEVFPNAPFKIPNDTPVRTGTGVVRTVRKVR